MKLRFLALSALPLLASLAIAQSPAPKPDPRISSLLDNLGKTVEVREVAISPDASTVAYAAGQGKNINVFFTPLGKSDEAKDATWFQPLPTNKPCETIDSSIAFSPDSKHLAFVQSCEDEPSGIIVADTRNPVSSGSTKPFSSLIQLHGYITGLRYTPDGKFLSFLYVENATRPAGALAAMKPPSGVIGVDNLEIQRIASVDLATGKLTQLTPANLHVYEYDWSPDGTQLVYTAAAPPGENNWWIAQLYTQRAKAGEEPKSIWKQTKPEEQIAVPRWSPDGKQIAYIGGLMSDQGSTGGDIFLIPAAGGPAKNITRRRGASPAWIQWIDPKQLELTEVASGTTHLAFLNVETGVDAPDSFTIPGTVHANDEDLSLSLAKGGEAYILSSFNKPPEVYAGAGSAPKQITHFNDALKPAWGKAESVAWSNDGFKLQGWLLYPLNYDPAKKYPLIVYVHGGPASAVLPSWPHVGFTGVAFSTLDYFVFMPNPRGSYGQGEEFTAANRKDFGYGDLRDILTGLDAVEKSHNVDDRRIGLTGWSYGGFMTMFAVTQTQRFKAAVAGAGVSNWQSYYGENSIDQWMVPYFGASVYDDPDVYAKSSAINFIHRARTPTLAVVGDRDGECPAPQSFEFWHALRAQGTPTELVVYPNEGHHFASPEHQRDVLTRALQWFQQYMP